MAVENVHTELTFWRAFFADLSDARCRVLLHSGFLSPHRIRLLEPVFRRLIKAKVTICVFVQEPRCMSKKAKMRTESDIAEIQYFMSCIEMLTSLGVHVTTRPKEHEKLAIIDDQILWEGSLNPLSHLDTKERMRRFSNRTEAMEAIKLHKMDKCTKCLENRVGCKIGDSENALSEYFARRRKSLGLSQKKLAEKVGVHHTRISTFENGSSGLTLEVLLAIARELEVELLPVPTVFVPSVTQVLSQCHKP